MGMAPRSAVRPAAPSACPETDAMGRGPRGGSAVDDVQAVFQRALAVLRRSGHDLAGGVEVAVDPDLGFMGYTRPLDDGRFRIVVSGDAAASGMLPVLLVHELSHVVRIRSGHPSHDPEVLWAVTDDAGALREDYQRKALHDLLNNVQDLYADDVGFRVLREAGLLDPAQVTAFLQDWVTPGPERTGDRERDAWTNAWLLANNARALGQLARTGLGDPGGKAARGNEAFLAALPPGARAHFEPLRAFLAGLPEDVAAGKLKGDLDRYVRRYFEVVAALR